MATQLEFWNQALTFLQQPMRVSVETTRPDEAHRLLNANWRSAAKQALEMGHWDFSMKRMQLAQIGLTPAFRWAFYYQIPADCAHLVLVSRDGRIPMYPDRYEVDDSKLATDTDTVYVRFVTYDGVNQPGLWSK